MDYKTNEYIDNNPTWHIEDSPYKAALILELFNRNNLQPSTVCEVGCGAGEVLRQLHMRMNGDVSFTGYEISPSAFQLCLERKSDKLDYKLENFLENTTASYDVVMAIDVVEHVEDCFGFLRALREGNRGKHYVFRFPLDMSAYAVCRINSILESRKRVGHIHYFSKETALALLEDTGYEIMDSFLTFLKPPVSSMKSRLFNSIRSACFRRNPDLTSRVFGGCGLMVLAR